MAFTNTLTSVTPIGQMKLVTGTFTSATGDTAQTLTATDHGLNYIAFYDIHLDAGGLNTPSPKVSRSGGSLTITWDDTLGYSGDFTLIGR